jgi:cytochrome c
MFRILIMPFNRLFLVVAATVIASCSSAVDTSVAAPNIENGKATFNIMCAVCHSVQKTGGAVEGPNLLGLVGRQAASHPGFGRYSNALRASNLTWNVDTLDRFLSNPMETVPGTIMPMLIADDETRANVIAYLATLEE